MTNLEQILQCLDEANCDGVQIKHEPGYRDSTGIGHWSLSLVGGLRYGGMYPASGVRPPLVLLWLADADGGYSVGSSPENARLGAMGWYDTAEKAFDRAKLLLQAEEAKHRLGGKL